MSEGTTPDANNDNLDSLTTDKENQEPAKTENETSKEVEPDGKNYIGGNDYSLPVVFLFSLT